MTEETSYDEVAYPSTVFQQTHPERLFAMAWLHGLEPPPVETARILEIGGGDGMNVISIATAYPRTRALSFDLSARAVARGQAVIRDADLTNVRVEVGDILEAAETMDGTFDYIVCHGVYAWVPEIVRDAILKLVGRVLAPGGVAYISYNAMPGGHLRIAIREMLLRHVGHINDPAERIATAQAFLDEYGKPQDNDRAVQATMREMARGIRSKRGSVLYHDELGEIFAPQALADIAAAAAAHGLHYLTDAGPGILMDGFVEEGGTDDSQVAIVRAAQMRDDDGIRFFRQSLFIRDTQRPVRQIDNERIKALYVGVKAQRLENNVFKSKGTEFELTDPDMIAVIDQLMHAWPARVKIGEVSDKPAIIRALFHQWDFGLTELFGAPLPCAGEVPERPQVSPLVRAQLADGETQVCSLDQHLRRIDEPGPRAFLEMLDGRHTVPELEALWAKTEWAESTPFAAAMGLALKACLVMKD